MLWAMTGSKTLSWSWPASAAEGDGQVVADDLEGDLVDDLGDDRVHLARHDRGPGLHLGQVDLVEPGPGPRAQEPEVVGDFRKLDGQALHGRGEHDEGAGVLGGLDQVRGQPERQSRKSPRRSATASPPYSGLGADARPDGRPAEMDFLEEGGVLFEPVDLLLQGDGEGLELLAEGHRDGVLELGPAHLDDAREFPRPWPGRRR